MNKNTIILNHYPLWKNITIFLIVIIGFIYALPNLYKEDPSIQVTGSRGSLCTLYTKKQIQFLFKKENIISKSIYLLKNGIILVRFFSIEEQMHAHEKLLNYLDKNYIVALNFSTSAPSFFSKIGAKPIKLGLDLRGGVHFLIEVDMESVLKKLIEQSIDAFRIELHEKNIHSIKINELGKYVREINFQNTKECKKAFSSIYSNKNLFFRKVGKNILHASLKEESILEAREHALQQNLIILRNRINKLGITEPLIQRQGSNRIIVELPGIQDTALAKEIIGATATLEFRLVNNMVDPINIGKNKISEDSELKYTYDGQPVVLYKKLILSGDHLINAMANRDEYNRAQVDIYLDSVGGTIMYNFTKDNVGKIMAVILVEYKDCGEKDIHGNNIFLKKEEVINIATIQSILGNRFCITGLKNFNEAKYLAILLRSGYMMVPIKIIEERIIGPILGMQNIKTGLKACLFGLIVSILFMIILYRLFGFIASLALIVNLVLIIGIISILPGVTLTMPGIAGIILTLAVAIDANVLINERIKEELRNGRTIHKSIHEGYRGAFSSILDANITTMITAVILYTAGTGSIKGFAITTVIGVITSMFTAIFYTRSIVNFIYGRKNFCKLSI